MQKAMSLTCCFLCHDFDDLDKMNLKVRHESLNLAQSVNITKEDFLKETFRRLQSFPLPYPQSANNAQKQEFERNLNTVRESYTLTNVHGTPSYKIYHAKCFKARSFGLVQVEQVNCNFGEIQTPQILSLCKSSQFHLWFFWSYNAYQKGQSTGSPPVLIPNAYCIPRAQNSF